MPDELTEPQPGDPVRASLIVAIIRFVKRIAFDVAPPLTWNRVGGRRVLGITLDLFAVAKATAGVPALSGSAPGSASVRRYTFDGATLADGGYDITAYNIGSAAVGVGKWVILVKVLGAWFVVTEGC